MRGMDWTDYELRAALRLLSSNVLKLKEFLYALVNTCHDLCWSLSYDPVYTGYLE